MIDESRRQREAGFRNAPEVGAFYFEEAVKILTDGGCKIGGVEFVLQPRLRNEAIELAERFNAYLSAGDYDSPLGEMPEKVFRVIRCRYERDDPQGNPVFSLLLTKPAKMRSREDSRR